MSASGDPVSGFSVTTLAFRTGESGNVFSTAGTFRFLGERLEGLLFEGNLYAGEMEGCPADPRAIRGAHPLAAIRGGVVSVGDGLAGGEFAFVGFSVRGAGLLPTSRWLAQRDASLARSVAETPLP